MDCSGMNQFDGNGKPSKKGGRKVKGKKGKGRTSFTRLSHCRLFRFKRPRKSPSHGNQNKGEVESPSPRVVSEEDIYCMWKSMCFYDHDHNCCMPPYEDKPTDAYCHVEELTPFEIEEEGLQFLYDLSD